MDTPEEQLPSFPRRAIAAFGAAFWGLLDGFTNVPSYLKEGFHEAWIGLRSPDHPTRRMARVFYLSLFGVFATFYAFGRYSVERNARVQVAERIEAERAAAEKARLLEAKRLREPPPYQTLGTFSLEIREPEGVAKGSGLRAAEMEIFVSCSDIEVCEWIAHHVDLARGELGSLFTPTEREKILSPSGKKAFREEIRDALNRLLEQRGVKGVVIEVLFPRFIVS